MSATASRLPPPWVTRIGVITGLLILWEVLGRMGTALFFSPFSTVVMSGHQIFLDAEVRQALLTTGWVLGLIGVALAAGSVYVLLSRLGRGEVS